MRVLVTGGAGFIGSHTCVELLNKEHEVLLLDNFTNAGRDVPEKIGRITGQSPAVFDLDLTDRAGVFALFQAQRIDAVIHFAGLKAVGESVEKPLAYYENNLTGSLNLLSAMASADVKKLVFSSSATVYGAESAVPFKEDAPLSATNPYGATKLMLERILSDLSAADPSLSILMLRYFNPVGAHKSGLIGENPRGIPNNLVPYIAGVATGELACVSVYGDDYDTKDGTGVRDYIHVVDLARGHLAALDYLKGHTGIEAVNLGTGKGISVLEMIRSYEKACGRAIPYRIAPRRAGDIAACWADTHKAQELLHFSTQYDVDAMCRDSWHFIQNSRQI